MTNEKRIYRNALKATVILMAGLALAAVAVGWPVAQGNGIVAGLVGVAVAALAGITTQVSMLLGHRMTPASMAALMLGTWLLKMVLIVIALLVLRDIEDFHRGMFAGVVMVGVLGTVAIDLWVIQKGRLTYVDPSSKK